MNVNRVHRTRKRERGSITDSRGIDRRAGEVRASFRRRDESSVSPRKDVAWTKARIDSLKIAFSVLQEEPTQCSIWEDLVPQHNVTGKSAHDARLAAAARVHNVDAVLTVSDRNVTRYPLTVLAPADVARAG